MGSCVAGAAGATRRAGVDLRGGMGPGRVSLLNSWWGAGRGTRSWLLCSLGPVKGGTLGSGPQSRSQARLVGVFWGAATRAFSLVPQGPVFGGGCARGGPKSPSPGLVWWEMWGRGHSLMLAGALAGQCGGGGGATEDVVPGHAGVATLVRAYHRRQDHPAPARHRRPAHRRPPQSSHPSPPATVVPPSCPLWPPPDTRLCPPRPCRPR